MEWKDVFNNKSGYFEEYKIYLKNNVLEDTEDNRKKYIEEDFDFDALDGDQLDAILHVYKGAVLRKECFSDFFGSKEELLELEEWYDNLTLGDILGRMLRDESGQTNRVLYVCLFDGIDYIESQKDINNDLAL